MIPGLRDSFHELIDIPRMQIFEVMILCCDVSTCVSDAVMSCDDGNDGGVSRIPILSHFSLVLSSSSILLSTAFSPQLTSNHLKQFRSHLSLISSSYLLFISPNLIISSPQNQAPINEMKS